MAASDNPLLTGSNAFPGSGPVLNWIREAVLEGEGLMKNDPLYDSMDSNMDYVLGKQKILASTAFNPAYLSKVVINETHRSIRRHVSALTDIKPVFAYRTGNPNFQQHGLLLNTLVTVWWINTFADLALADAAKYAATAGAGDLVLEYDPYFGPMGDMRLMARDPRDTVPIRPSRDGSIQNWFGCILREAHSPNVLKAMYPQHIEKLRSDTPWGAGVFTKFKATFARIMGSGETSTLSGLNKTHSGRLIGDEIVLYRCYLHDAQVNTTSHPVLMGQAGTSWSYLVKPGDRLYPRKRLIVCTERVILYDGPNTYWHGLFPVTRLMLDRWPWSFFGLPIVNAMMPLQDAINELASTMIQKVKIAAAPAMVGNSRVPRGMLAQTDLRKPNTKIHTNEQVGTGITIPVLPDLPANTFELFQSLRSIFHEIAGDSTLDALQQAALHQIPDPESIEAFMAALSPELKLEGRQIEVTLRELADMMKANFFQFYDQERRMMVLGDAGLTLEDFDYDPGNLIPAMQETDPQTGQPTKGYLPQLNANIDQRDRAQFFLKLFTFYVTPNSLLALNARSEQMKYIQLARAGWVDFWTLMEKLEVPNVGKPPIMMLPMEKQPDEQTLMAIAQGLVPGANIDPNTGQALTLREPTTITERLQAQAMLGLGMEVSPSGRKASGQVEPHVETQPMPGGGQRIKMSESAHDHKKHGA
jgi:hypothetical protein